MRTLYAKLSAALLVLLLLLGTVTAVVTIRTSRLHMLEVQQELHRELAAKVVEEQPRLHDATARDEALDLIFEKLMVINPDIEIYLLDGAGRILGYSAPPGRVQQEVVDLEPVRTFLDDHTPLPILGTDPRNPDSANIFSVAPIRADGDEGYLYIVLASEQLDSALAMVSTSYILQTGVFMVAGSLVLALLGGVLMFRRLTRRLRQLAGEIADFERRMLGRAGQGGEMAGEAGERSPATAATAPADEVDALERGFRDMSHRISRQVAELEARDEERRDLLANISHDVRTPLTHLQGYLETLLLKGDGLSGEERGEYLQIAVQRSEQLGRLVADLLDLAKLDAPKRLEEQEEFSIAELVQDVVQQFELAAEEDGIELAVRIDAERARIRGNLGTIERALQNLIENAVRYSRRGDRVEVCVGRAAAGVEIAVRDTGPGIPPDELEHIFDRFYRCRGRGGGSQEGSGLGLSIARRALELHGADLLCESRVGEGTTFRFSLPRTADL
jgi:signal transduction histidine kinase